MGKRPTSPLKNQWQMSKGKPHPKNLAGFKSLFDTLYPSLCLFANRYLKDMDMSKDVVQDVFIKIWNKKLVFKNHNATKAYLYTSVKNHCLNYLKSKNFRTLVNTSRINIAEIQSEDYFISEVVSIETYAELYRAIDSLPSKTAKVIQLALNNYSTNDIAEELAVTPSTVRTQKSIAYQKLRVILNHLNQLFLNL